MALYAYEESLKIFSKDKYSDWIFVKCCIILKKSIPQNKLFDLYQKLLYANYLYAELTFSVDEEGNVYAESDMPSEADFENFKSEFSSIFVVLVHFFTKIFPELDLIVSKQDTV